MYIYRYWYLHRPSGKLFESKHAFESDKAFMETMARWNNNKDQDWIYFIKKWPIDRELAPK